MSRAYLAIGAAVVAAAVIGLYVLLRVDDPPAAAPVAPAAGPKIADPDPDNPRRAPVPAPPRRTADPAIGDQRIRDHRTGQPPPEAPAPAEPPATSPPPRDRRIAAPITTALSQSLMPSLQQCAANLAPGSHGARSRIEGEVTIAIRDHRATITSAAFQLRDFTGDGTDEIRRCLVEHAVGVAAPAGDEADASTYPITVSLRWP